MNLLKLKKEKDTRQTPSRNYILAAILSSIYLVSIGCSKQEFDVISSTAPQKAPGTYTIPPKVDILLAEDDTGSMFEAYDLIARELPVFLDDLNNRGWDYHFAVTPLTRDRGLAEFDEIVASRHDINWGNDWLAPYPGAPRSSVGSVDTLKFRRPERFSRFLPRSEVTNNSGGLEAGFAKINLALTTHVNGAGFLRDDAILVILVIGNGNDTSEVNICRRVDGYSYFCADDSDNASRILYRDRFLAVKDNHVDNPLLRIKFFAAVADDAIKGCLSRNKDAISRAGTRYKWMAGALGGTSHNVCASGSIQATLNSISSTLQFQKLSLRTNYLFLDRTPDPATIKVIRYRGGDVNQPQELLEDPSRTNGWTYEGYLSDVFAIDFPIQMNRTSGYAIALHGDARLIGEDSAAVTFKPAGARDSSR